MPSSAVRRIVKTFGISMDICKFISDQFQVSLMAAAVKCMEVTNRRAALVVTEGGIRKRFKPSSGFTEFINIGAPLSPDSLASELSVSYRKKSGLVPAEAWIDSSLSDVMIMEESLLMPNYQIILDRYLPREASAAHLSSCLVDRGVLVLPPHPGRVFRE